jgi:hypothetical protein
VRTLLKHGEGGKEAGECAVILGGGAHLLYGSGTGAGRGGRSNGGVNSHYGSLRLGLKGIKGGK